MNPRRKLRFANVGSRRSGAMSSAHRTNVLRGGTCMKKLASQGTYSAIAPQWLMRPNAYERRGRRRPSK